MRVRVLGRFAVTRPGGDVTPTGLAAEALKVVVSAGRSVHWEELAEALWPSTPPKRGRVRLRNVLSRLRARTGPVLVRKGDLIQLPSGIGIDAEEFETLARRALETAEPAEGVRLARQALEHYRGDFLPEDRYAEWALEPRDRLRRRFRALVELLVADARRRRDLEGALLLLERALTLEPEDEELALEMVEVLNELGRRAAALRLLERVQATLETAGLPISARWLSLYRQARRDGD